MTISPEHFRRSVQQAREESYADGYRDGAHAYEGLMAMARVIGARERAKPAAVAIGPCNRRHPDANVRCNLVNDHGGKFCKRIGTRGIVLYSWVDHDRSKDHG